MKSEKRNSLPRRLNDMIFEELFQQVPFNVAVIDRDYNIVQANRNFSEYFGDLKGKKCYKVYKKLNQPCKDCPSVEVFKKGKSPSSMALTISEIGLFKARTAARGPIPETLINC